MESQNGATIRSHLAKARRDRLARAARSRHVATSQVPDSPEMIELRQDLGMVPKPHLAAEMARNPSLASDDETLVLEMRVSHLCICFQRQVENSAFIAAIVTKRNCMTSCFASSISQASSSAVTNAILGVLGERGKHSGPVALANRTHATITELASSLSTRVGLGGIDKAHAQALQEQQRITPHIAGVPLPETESERIRVYKAQARADVEQGRTQIKATPAHEATASIEALGEKLDHAVRAAMVLLQESESVHWGASASAITRPVAAMTTARASVLLADFGTDERALINEMLLREAIDPGGKGQTSSGSAGAENGATESGVIGPSAKSTSGPQTELVAFSPSPSLIKDAITAAEIALTPSPAAARKDVQTSIYFPALASLIDSTAASSMPGPHPVSKTPRLRPLPAPTRPSVQAPRSPATEANSPTSPTAFLRRQRPSLPPSISFAPFPSVPLPDAISSEARREAEERDGANATRCSAHADASMPGASRCVGGVAEETQVTADTACQGVARAAATHETAAASRSIAPQAASADDLLSQPLQPSPPSPSSNSVAAAPSASGEEGPTPVSRPSQLPVRLSHRDEPSPAVHATLPVLPETPGPAAEGGDESPTEPVTPAGPGDSSGASWEEQSPLVRVPSVPQEGEPTTLLSVDLLLDEDMLEGATAESLWETMREQMQLVPLAIFHQGIKILPSSKSLRELGFTFDVNIHIEVLESQADELEQAMEYNS